MGWGGGGAVYGYFFFSVKEYTVALITLMNERLGELLEGGVLLLFVALGDNFSHVSSL